MFRFPFMNIPFPYYKNYSRLPNPYNYSPYYNPSIHSSNGNASNHKFERKPEYETQKNKSNSNEDDYLFDLFGLKLYFDDILILSLLYFLYNEGVKDEMLFISLLLLLIS